MNSHTGGEKDGFKGPAFRIGPEEEESHPLSSWGEGGKRKCMKIEFVAAENACVPFPWQLQSAFFLYFVHFY